MIKDFINKEQLDDMFRTSQSILYIGDKENSNMDSALVSTKRSLLLNHLNRELYKENFLNDDEREALNDGYIYIHDMSARLDTMNCCLFDIKDVLKGGFEMSNIWYNEPKTLDTVFDVIGDIVLSAAGQQYGGFTVPNVDLLLEPYAEKSYEKYLNIYKEHGLSYKESELEAFRNVENDMRQGFQGWEYKFNTVSSSRGDYPFTTITFGTGTGRFAKLASITALRVRRNGQGLKGKKKPVLYPKLVFLYDEDLHGKGAELEDVFEEGILHPLRLCIRIGIRFLAKVI
jgi:ribonucleoside-triphosphate reductase